MSNITGEGVAMQAAEAFSEASERYQALFHAAPVAMYRCDGDGMIQEFNQRAVELWGREPRLGDPNERYCGSYKLYHPDGQPMPHAECPMARALRGEVIEARAAEILIERANGTRSVVVAHPQPLRNEQGEITGAVNFLTDITESKRTEQALRESEARLAAELADVQRLQYISGQLIQEGNLDALYALILDAAIAIMRSDMGSMQMLDADTQALRLLAWKGFDPASAAFWQWVRPESGCTCGAALARGERVVAPDVETWALMAGSEDIEIYRLSGIQAVQSTPLISRDGRIVGMISTHWRERHQPSERELRLLDTLARQAADLIERKRAEDALRAKSAELRRLMDTAGIGLTQCSRDLRYLAANPAYAEIVGLPLDAIVGRSIVEVIGKEALKTIRPFIERVLRGERVEHASDIPLAAGGLRHIHTIYTPETDAQGEIVGWVASVTDVTARKQVENALAEQLGQLEATFESMVDGVAIYDSQGRIVRLNSALRELLGLDETYTALSVDERVPRLSLRDGQQRPLAAEQTPPARVARGEIFTGGASMDMLAHTLDGREIEVNVSGAPVRDAEGRIVGGVCVYRDITARHQTELAVHESEEKFRTLADHIPTLCWMAYPDGNIFWYNQRWYDYTGTTPESQKGWGWETVHDPATLPAVMERWKQSLATGEDFEMVFPLRGADGVFRPFLTRIIAVKDERGSIVRWFGTNVDITEQRASEEALRVANQVKEEFLSVASHELRTPLTSIMPNVQLAGRQLRALLNALAEAENEGRTSQEDARHLEQRARRPLQLIENTERQVRRLSRLVDDLLDVSRIQTGKLELRLVPCDLLDIARESVHEQRAAWPGRRVTLDLPRRASLVIQCDADRIGQVLTNYLTNALKYSPEDQPVAVRVRAHGGTARVEVSDRGPGLTDEQRARLFERFYRVPGIEQQSGSGIGLGLGLYICQSLVERHGGQVGVESAPGEGSTFWFTVPLLTGDAADDIERSAPR